MKFIDKDKSTKRYFLLIEQLTSNPLLPAVEGTKKTISIFSNFSEIVFKGLFRFCCGKNYNPT